MAANRPTLLARGASAADVQAEISGAIALINHYEPSAKLPELTDKTTQHDLVDAVMTGQRDRLLADPSFTLRDRALLLAESQPKGYLWKCAAHTTETFFNGRNFELEALRAVGEPVATGETRCGQCQQALLDAHGDHALTCQFSSTRVLRHDTVVSFLATEMKGAQIPCALEHTITKAHGTYRADIIVSQGVPGMGTHRATAFDVTVRSPFASSHVARAASVPLYAALEGEKEKLTKQEKDLDDLDWDFFPLAFECTGDHTEPVDSLVSHIVSQRVQLLGASPSEEASRIWQRLAVTIRKANAFMLRNCLSHEEDFEDD
jgi:hypothetical protein